MNIAKKDLLPRYSYQTRYFKSAEQLKKGILEKTIIPYQVEVQPGPEKGNICWLKCPYCYGISANNTDERLSLERYLEILNDIAEGGVNKIVFAGYATDPLNYQHIDDLHQITLKHNQVFGFHTKAIKISNRLIAQITSTNIAPSSYFSVSVDAGYNESYNRFHGVPKSKAKIYDKVCNNIRRLSEARNKSNAPLDISATYLISSMNNSEDEIRKAIRDLRGAGIDLIRFTFPQKPRGFSAEMTKFIPEKEEVNSEMERLRPLIQEENRTDCQVLILDLDSQYSISNLTRSLPCFARFIFPSIGFDGWLSHCSESAAPHFREMALGNLQESNFWDIFYDYEVENMTKMFANNSNDMNRLGCKCDRKEHVVNIKIKKSGVFDKFT